MKTKIIVKGMKCQHCEAHVKDAIEKIDGVNFAKPDRAKSEVEVESNREINEEEYKLALSHLKFTFEGIKK